MTTIAEFDRRLRRLLLFEGFVYGTMAVSALALALMLDDKLMSTFLAAGGAVAAWGSGAAFTMRHALTQQVTRTEEVVAFVEPSQRPALLARLNEGAAAYRDLWHLALPIACAVLTGVFVVVAALVAS